MSLRVLVVDDTVVFRRAVSDALEGIPDVEVAGVAVNGKLALARLPLLKPDLITLDIEMPEMNGIEMLERLKASGSKAGVIMLSALTTRGGEMTVRALELGAFDFITKPEGKNALDSVTLLRGQLAPMIRAFLGRRRSGNAGQAPMARSTRVAAPVIAPAVFRTRASMGSPLVLIGVSTGGPAALGVLLPKLPAGLPSPVFIVQHMPPLFTKPLAASLAARCAIAVKEAVDGEHARPACAYIAPGGRQMKLTRGPREEIIIRITDDPPENNCRPAVDYLFRSAALQFPGRSVAVILTGMGSDGTRGLQQLKRGGCLSIAQEEASCVVFGMPKEAIQAGVVDVVAPLDVIAAAIVKATSECSA